MKTPDFTNIKKLTEALQDFDGRLQDAVNGKARQEESVRLAAAKIRKNLAVEALEKIPVEELSKSKAGIRTAMIREAGYENLKQLALLTNQEIKGIPGIGDKQTEAIRNILLEFINRLMEHQMIRLSEDEMDADGKQLICTLAAYRMGEKIREEITAQAESIHGFAEDVLSRVSIKSRFRWIFSAKKRKEQTAEAVGEIAAFFRTEGYWSVNQHLKNYEQALNIGQQEAVNDFGGSSADYYALLEKLGGYHLEKPLIYSSIPAKLAQEIDEEVLNSTCFKGNLRSYQTFGAKYIIHQKRVLLGDEMGLGKTVQAIAAMAHLQAEYESDQAADRPSAQAQPHFLVVCPASVLVNWCREIQKFSMVEPILVHGEGIEDAFASWKEKGGAAVTNYESMGKIIRQIDRVMRLSLLVIDEAHYIKNPDAKRSKYIRRLDDESERIVMMTGTPLENRVEEMCSLIDFVRPDLSAQVRKSAYMSKLPEFKELLAPVYLRRVREDVLEELPNVEETSEWCGVTAEDLAAYRAAVAERSFPSMRRISFLQDDMTRSSKAIRLLELCQMAEEEGRKTVVFSYFRDTIEKVSTLLGEQCAGTITGSTKPADRQMIIDRFTQEKESSVLVCQIQAGGTGLNIQTASVVIFTEPQIKPSLTNQAIARVYRMGQTRTVLVFHLLCADTIDEAIQEVLYEKQAEFDKYADDSRMAEEEGNLFDREWIQSFIDKEQEK